MTKKTVKQFIVILASFVLCAVLLFSATVLQFGTSEVLRTDDEIRHAFAAEEAADVVYLSDLRYDTNGKTNNTNKNLMVTGKWGGTPAFNAAAAAQVKIEGAWYSFEKGIYAHANSLVAYDLSQVGTKYKYFTAYGGLRNTATSKSDGVKLRVQGSNDGTNWTELVEGTEILVPYGADAVHFEIDISNYSWIRLYANQNSHNAMDHMVWADAKLTNTLEDASGIQSLTYYDNELKKYGINVDITNPTVEKLILQRELVSRVGQYALKRFLTDNPDHQAMWNWLFKGDLDVLREFVLGGAPMAGSYYNSLTVLADLYKNYKKDLENTTLLNNKFMPNRTRGELCRTMMFSVALTHDHAIGSYLQGSKPENSSEPLRRYAIFRYLYDTNRFKATDSYETMSLFGSLRVEEMRFIMSNIIDDESILWLNDYVQTRINANPKNASGLHTPHSYVRYTDPNYGNPVFYADENYDYFNKLFAVDARGDNGVANNANKFEEGSVGVGKVGMWDTEYIVPAGEGQDPYVMKITRSGENEPHIQKVWMNFNNKFKTGSVCGGISKSGTNIRTARGIPAHVIGQPNHAAILYYTKNAQGQGGWSIDNNVGGWVAATKNERHLLGWGNATWQRNSGGGGTVVFFLIAQEALNDYDNYVKAEEYTFLAKVYQGDLDKQEDLYEKALSTQGINLDAWYGLIQTCKAKSNKTAQDFAALAERAADNVYRHPLALHCIFKLLSVERDNKGNIVSPTPTDAQRENPVFTSQLQMLEANAMAKAKTSGSSAAKEKANFILGATNTSVADFSFDGDHAGCIVWDDSYKGTGFTWKYSLDGKQTWKEVIFVGDEDAPVHQLNEDELESISADHDIYVYIVGANPDNAYKIEVVSKPALPTTLYANDWENRVIGVDTTYEWRYLDADEQPTTGWISYSEASPDCSGDRAIEVRIKRSSNKPASESGIFRFTANIPVDTPERRYISVNYLSIESFSTQSKDAKRPNYAVNAIDGNANTYWHTDYAISIKEVKFAPEDTKKENPLPYAPAFLTMKLDVPRWISALEFSQTQYNPSFSIFAKTATVFVSEDGETWKEAGKLQNIENVEGLRAVHFKESVYGQYVKLEMTAQYDTNKNDGIFTTVSMVNLYEDTTKTKSPTGEAMPSLSDITPSGNGLFGLGEVISEEKALEIGGEPTDDEEEDLNDYIHIAKHDKKPTNLAAAIAVPIVCVVLIGGGVAAFFILKRKGIIKGKPSGEKAAAKKSTKKDVAEKKPAAKKDTAEKKPVEKKTTEKKPAEKKTTAKKDAAEKKPTTKKKES